MRFPVPASAGTVNVSSNQESCGQSSRSINANWAGKKPFEFSLTKADHHTTCDQTCWLAEACKMLLLSFSSPLPFPKIATSHTWPQMAAVICSRRLLHLAHMHRIEKDCMAILSAKLRGMQLHFCCQPHLVGCLRSCYVIKDLFLSGILHT